jgi:hypothetical protein
LGRELIEAAGLKFPLPRIRRHGAESVNGIAHGAPAIHWQVVELRTDPAQVLFLLRREMLPRFHSVQHLLLAISRHAVEPLQALFVLSLGFARKTAECRIALKGARTLLRRQLPFAIQPLA